MSWRVDRTGSNVDFDALLKNAVADAKRQVAGNPWANQCLDRSADFLTTLHATYPRDGQVHFVLSGHRGEDGYGTVGATIESQPPALAALEAAEAAEVWELPDPEKIELGRLRAR